MADITNLRNNSETRALNALTFWHAATCRALAALPQDLSSRQMGILLTVYLSEGPHSVKHLSEQLGISKPAVCRAIDVLECLKFLRRQRDKADKRNVLLQRTAKGAAYLSSFAEVIVSVTKAAR